MTIAWSTVANNRVRVRTSLDGGLTWASTRTIGTYDEDGDPHADAHPTVSIGRGVTYVAYRDGQSLLVRRSLDQGTTWQPARILAATATDEFDLIASGSTAILGFGAIGSTGTGVIRHRHTADRGVTWSTPAALSPTTGNRSTLPALAYRAGVWVATFTRCLDPDCKTSAVYLRTSLNGGATWTPTARVSRAWILSAWTAGSAIAGGKHVVAFVGLPDETTASYIYARAEQ